MNEPGHRARWAIELDDGGHVRSTRALSAGELDSSLRLRKIDVLLERVGILRHVLRYLQWDHGLGATTVMRELVDDLVDHPVRYPGLRWMLDHFAFYPAPPVGWSAVFDEVERFVEHRHPDSLGDGLSTVLTVQQFLLPHLGRVLPATIPLDHDYVAYYHSATNELWRTGRPGRPDRPLVAFPPGTLTITDDPLGLCRDGLHQQDRKDHVRGERDYLIGGDEVMAGDELTLELRSPLMRGTLALQRAGVALPVRRTPAVSDAHP